jgi:hypothetical protein
LWDIFLRENYSLDVIHDKRKIYLFNRIYLMKDEDENTIPEGEEKEDVSNDAGFEVQKKPRVACTFLRKQ